MRTSSSRPRLPGSRKSRGRWKTGWSRNRSTTAISRPAWMMLAISCGIGGSTPRPGSGHEPKERGTQIRTTRSHSPGRCLPGERARSRESPRPQVFRATSTTFPPPRTNRRLRPGQSLSSLRVPLRGGQRSPMIPHAPHPRTTIRAGNRSRPQLTLRHHGDKASPSRRAGVRMGESLIEHSSGGGSVLAVSSVAACDGADGDGTIPPGGPRNRSESQPA